MKIKVLTVQIEPVSGNISANMEKVSALLNNKLKNNTDLPDIIVLPELWTIGWDCSNFLKYSQELYSSDTYNFLSKMALKYNSNIIGGSSILHKSGQKSKNSCLIFDRNAKLKAVYDKYHLFSHRGESEGTFLEEGNSGLIVNTDVGKIGISICYDIRFPELFRLYAFKGADLMVNMAAWPLGFFDEYQTLLKARAVENQIYFVSSCLTGKINNNYLFSGESQICDFRGKIISKLERNEDTLYAQLDIDKMYEYRAQMPILKDTKSDYKVMEIQ